MALTNKTENSILIAVSILIILFIGGLLGYFYAKDIFDVKVPYSISKVDQKRIDSLQNLVTKDSIAQSKEVDYEPVYLTKIKYIRQKYKEDVKAYYTLDTLARIKHFKSWANRAIRDSATARRVSTTNQ